MQTLERLLSELKGSSTWRHVDDEEAVGLKNQLNKELSSNHKLSNITKSLIVVARDKASDDILLREVDDLDRYYLVHLTWQPHPDSHVDFPWSESINDPQELRKLLSGCQ